jgi:hypothetical protein
VVSLGDGALLLSLLDVSLSLQKILADIKTSIHANNINFFMLLI